MQILGPHPNPTESESLRVGLSSPYLTSPPGDASACLTLSTFVLECGSESDYAPYFRRQGGASPEGIGWPTSELVFNSLRVVVKVSDLGSPWNSQLFPPFLRYHFPLSTYPPPRKRAPPQKQRVAIQTHCFPLSLNGVSSQFKEPLPWGAALCWMEGRVGERSF